MTTWPWGVVPFAYIGQMGLPFVSMWAAFLTMLLAGGGLLCSPIKKWFRRFKRFRIRWGPILLLIGIGLVGGGVFIMTSGSGSTSMRVIVLGFDGLDPALLEAYMDQGLLPHFQQLKQQGTYRRLATTNPALSPVAWSSFVSGSNPGRHGLFDFITRDRNTYRLDLALAAAEQPRSWLSRPRLKTQRKGVAFWDLTSRHRIPTTVLRMPVTFPPDQVYGRMLSGLGVPDLRGTQGTFAFYTTDAVETGRPMGGQVVQVDSTRQTIQATLIGPRSPLTTPPRETQVPFTLTRHQANAQVTIELQRQTFDLGVGQWSAWKRVTFPLNRWTKTSGIVRFYLGSVSPQLNLYVSPVNFDPRSPAFPISHPSHYAEELADEIGLYHTLGQAEDTWSLNEGRVSEETFLEQCQHVLHEREAMLRYELTRFRRGLLVCVFDTPDRIQHMFWRFQDPQHPLYDPQLAKRYHGVLPTLYQSMDRIVGMVMPSVDEHTVLIVLSDHGFSAFHTVVHLNAWLRQQGFLAYQPGVAPGDIRELLAGVDWAHTTAYAVGLAGIYLNRAGRERDGRVGAAEAPVVTEQIMQGLRELRDPATGRRVVHRVYRREEVYEGPFLEEAPDLILGFEEGYRTSWQTALGATPPTVLEPNTKRWSGDHCVDPPFVPGVLLMNRRIETEQPRIIDMAPTILKLFGIEVPVSMDGRSLLSGERPSETGK